MSQLSALPSRPLHANQRAIIVGASSGIGAALAEKLAQEGYQLVLIARREKELTTLANHLNNEYPDIRAFPIVHDVCNYEQIPALFEQAIAQLGGLNLIVYMAGVMPHVEIDEYSFVKDKMMIDINLLGAIGWLNEAAQRFTQLKEGHIVAISSIAGDRGRIKSPVYNTSKAALSTYLEALRNRLSRHGINVTTVKPGMVETTMLEHVEKTMWVIPTSQAADDIYRAIQKKKQTIYTPARWQLVSLIIRHIPSIIFRRLSI